MVLNGRHNERYQTLGVEAYQAHGQGLCQALRLFMVSRAGGERDLDESVGR